MFKQLMSIAGVVTALSAVPAAAHHSFAMFDATKDVDLTGTVKEFRWTNPHAWILIMIPDASGVPKQWAIEMGGPGAITRQGWSPKTLKRGDRITVRIHPLRDGTPGGQYLAVTLSDGKKLGDNKPV
jgi:hypothetical protein